MFDCIAAQITHESAVQWGTHTKQARVWKQWGEYNKLIGNNNFFLESFTWHQGIKLVGVFALALREGQFSGNHHDKLVEKTVTDSIQYVGATFRENGFPNPTFDDEAKSGFILQQLYQAFRNADPAEEHQKVIQISVTSELGKKTISELSTAVFELAGLGIFIACRSCEYLKVSAAEQWQTKILSLWNNQFFKDRQLLAHNHDELEVVDCVSTTFEQQKKDEKMDTVTSGDVTLCLVCLAASVIRQIWGCSKTNDDTNISAVQINGKLTHVMSMNVINTLQDAVEAIEEDRLGIKKEEVGTHSIRLGVAMAMYLGECPVYTIMLIRW